MSHLRRFPISGHTYFFTVRLLDPQSALLVSEIDLLRDATRLCRKQLPFDIDAAVILPNMLHMIWTLPDGDTDFSKRWRLIKSSFSRHVPAPDHIPAGRRRRGEKGIWQRRFWVHPIRDQADFDLHMHVIRSAPIHAGLVKRPGAWPYSSMALVPASQKPVKTIAPVPSSHNPATAATTSRTALIGTNEMS